MASQSPVWFISAASSGFGRYMALEALKNGHRVIATARSNARISDLKDQGAVTLDLDVVKPFSEIQAIVKQAHDIYGRFDYLVNPPGFVLEGAIEESSPEEVERSFRVNVFGVLNLTNAILPYMRAQRSGVIAHFGSLGSWRGVPAGGIYSSTKWAISGLTESLRLEVAGFGIQVCCVEPGYFRTGFLNPGARIVAEKKITDYDDGIVGQVKAMFSERDNKQLGDTEKGCRVMFEVFTQKGGKPVPERLPLGSDCFEGIGGKLADTRALLDEWKDVIVSTDHEEKFY